MINNNQMDLIQTIISMLSAYNSDLIKKLLKNIVVVGGGSVIAGLK
jgi:actin-related protein